MRLANVPISCVRYLLKMFFPKGMAVFYPMPDGWPIWTWMSAAIVMAIISIAVIRLWRRAPYLLVGWLWFLGTLVPTLSLVPVGGQSIADRYTYVPLIGLFIMLAWGAGDLAERWRWPQFAVRSAAVAASIGCIFVSAAQVQHWRNSLTLFEHAVAVTEDNVVAHNNLGNALLAEGRTNEALAQFSTVLSFKPNAPFACENLANVLASQGKLDEAIALYEQALVSAPHWLDLHNNLASALSRRGRYQEAIAHYQEGLRLKPDSAITLNNLAWLQATVDDARIRNGSEAVKNAERACELTARRLPVLIGTLAAAYAEAGRFEEALKTAQQTIDLAVILGQSGVAARNRELMEFYRAGRPYREGMKSERAD